MPHSPDFLDWTDEYPLLTDLGGYGGVPGCEYFYCDTEHEYDAQAEGYKRVIGSPVLRVTGPKGSATFVVMQRGAAVAALSRTATVQDVRVSDHLEAATGIYADMRRGLAPKPTPPMPASPHQNTTQNQKLNQGVKSAA